MHRWTLAFIAGLAITSTALAQDFWEKKEYMKWTDEEVKHVLTNSPWAKDVIITAPASVLGRGQRTASAAGTEVAASDADGGGRRGRGGGRGSFGDGGDASPR